MHPLKRDLPMRNVVSVDRLWDQAHNATVAAYEAQARLADGWSEYRSLTLSLRAASRQVQRALTMGQVSLDAHQQYHALVREIEAKAEVLQQAMVDVETAETARRAAFEAAALRPA
jgi:hypothetical protein